MLKDLTPIINVGVKMPKKMLHELNLFEMKCVCTKVKVVTEDEVKSFLLERNTLAYANTFKREYLFPVPEAT